MQILCIDPTRDRRWQRLVTQQHSSMFHAPEWLRVLQATYDFDMGAYILLDDGGNVRAGMPFCSIEDEEGKRLVSLPFSDFCDPLVHDDAEWNSLLDRLLAQECRVTLSCLHNGIPLANQPSAVVNRARWHRVDLQRNLDAIWESLDGAARRAIRKADRNGIVLRRAECKDELRAFYDLHLRVRKYKYHLLAQPYRFFEHIWDQFMAGENGALLLAYQQDELLGGVMFLEWQDTLYYKFNASSPAALAFRPNDFVIWEGIKYGREKGYASLDFGRSDWEHEGLVRYKRKFASEEKTISYLRFTPNGSAQHKSTRLRTLLPQLTDLFVDASVPDDVTERAGDILYRHFT